MAFRIFRVPAACASVLFAAATLPALSLAAQTGETKSPAAPAAAPVKDARFGWEFPYSVTLTKPTGETRLVIHYQSVGDAPTAEQAMRLYSRLLNLYKERTGMETAFFHDADKADVWLAAQRPETAQDGGETRQNQLYIFGIHDTRRTKLEWVRTLVHEWGHLTLPAARGYTDPETDASGYLGERLYMKWLYDDLTLVGENGQPVHNVYRINDGTTPDDLKKYYTRQIAPLMARFNRPEAEGGGPNAPVLLQKDTRAMDGYIGAVCACDTAWGSPQTNRALFGILGTTAPDFFASARTVWTRQMQTGKPVWVHLPAWVPLEKGTYRLTYEGRVPSKTLTQTQTGWKYLDGVGNANLVRAGKP